jgi:hypothetical protein
VSLVHEALRKARHDAAHQDDPGVVFPGGLTGKHRRTGLGIGLVIGVVLTVVAGALLVGVGWWVLRESADPAHQAGIPKDLPSVSESAAAIPETIISSTKSAQPEPQVLSTSDADLPPTTAAGPAEQIQPSTPETVNRPEASERASIGEALPPRVAETRGSISADERVFEVEADLGYAFLSLDYIVAGANDTYAQINGFDVRVGGHIEGFTVEEITAERVRLVDENGPLLLKVPDDLFGDETAE